MGELWKALTLILIIFAFVAILTNAAGFSTASSSFFKGLSQLGRTIMGA